MATNGGFGHSVFETNKEKNEIKEETKPLTNHFNSMSDNARNISEGNISIVGLKRRVGFISGTALIVGTMIGIDGLQCLLGSLPIVDFILLP